MLKMEMENNFHRRIFIEADITVPSLYIQRAPFLLFSSSKLENNKLNYTENLKTETFVFN